MALRLATRGSALALTQARAVAGLLGEAELVEASSDGEPGDKERFVRGVERALLSSEADLGVHSAKDVPSELTDGLAIVAVPEREEPRDAWIGPGDSLDQIPEGARVGTASLRRRAQLLALRPDIQVDELHGNVDTRLAKLADGRFDAIVLAAAGLRRLGRDAEIAFLFEPEEMTPAAGQGALLVQARADDGAAREATAAIGDPGALAELTAERVVVGVLEASCATPIGVHATAAGGQITIRAFVGLPDGSEWLRDRVEGPLDAPAALGRELATRLLAAGAGELLRQAETM